jgi:hypothetical protein
MHRDHEEIFYRANALGVTIYQRSKTVWVATGSHRGRHFEVKARSPAMALALWMEAAQYTGQRI